MFVGAVADNFDERIEQQIFHAEIIIDREKLAGETASYVPIPEISSFRDADGVDRMEEIIRRNYTQIKEDVTQIIKRGTQTHRRRPCAAASVGEEVGGSTSPPISVYHGLPSVLKSGNEECDFTLWTACKENVRFLFFNELIINRLRKFCHCYFILFFRKRFPIFVQGASSGLRTELHTHSHSNLNSFGYEASGLCMLCRVVPVSRSDVRTGAGDVRSDGRPFLSAVGGVDDEVHRLSRFAPHGIPEISIPLYTVRSGSLELPVNLSFHLDDFTRVNSARRRGRRRMVAELRLAGLAHHQRRGRSENDGLPPYGCFEARHYEYDACAFHDGSDAAALAKRCR